jgi:probable rRNA maturation factor
LSIKIFYDNTNFRLRGSRKTERVIEKVIRKEGRISGDLNFIFTDDETLHKINIQFLNHHYFTDVITFNYNDGDLINGEVYISIDMVKQNSINYNVSFKNEILRVMMHGILHLFGYEDKSGKEREKMKEKEDLLMADFNYLYNEL